ncbi:vascular cell adhesion protein 1-like isoform X1 [Carcharodon carcharias]|uniref:vascular cell adhesion protein 1-like isoform X1 n=1 Tax=Carcharodon carcharias TaxID=13397 RepID=UPI001B7EEDAD|nr:vascular cell adhesion protein 1-like isoform X1 [Carcharodon carcharias]
MASGRPYLYGALTLAVLIATGSTFSLKLQPKSKLWTRIGEKLVLSCESIDCPSPTFSWRTVTDNPLGGTVNSQGSVSTLTFSPVTRQNENTYICSVTYKGETQQRRVQVNVYSFPDEPVLETVGPLEVGKNGTLRCTVPDVYPVSLEVELLKGETSLNKQNFFRTPKVTISSQLVPEVGDSGKEVTCRARFLINDIQDKSLEGKLTLQVLYAPRMTNISVTPSHTVREGQDVRLICATDSSPPARIVWSKASADGWSVIAEEKLSLQLPAAQVADTGMYRCEASNKLGGEARELEIHIQGAPRDTRLSVTPSVVKEGDYVSVTCTSHSNPSAHIVLRKKSETGLTVLDSENGTFTIDAAQFGDAGQYECEASNDLGTDNTTAELTVLGAPRDTRLSVTPSVVKEGDYISVTCTSHSNPSAHIVLRKKSESGLTVLDSENGIFTIDAAQFGDAGQYECEASNDLGTDNTMAELTVLGAPRDTRLSVTPSVVKEGDYVSVTCTSHSNPSAHIVLRKKSETGLTVLDSENGIFIIDAAQFVDAGQYECEASNDLGTDNTMAELTVLGAPRDTRLSVTPSVVKEGDYVSVTCTSHSNPSAHIVLRKKSETGLTVLDSENGTFTIDAAQFGDAGQYECEASNDLGTDNTMAELTVLGAPRDTRLSVTPSVVKEGDYVSVTCTSHSNPSAHIVLRKKSETGLMVLDSKNGIFIIDAAQFVDAGQYECEASNDMGRQIQSTELIVQVLTLWAHPSMLVSEGENVTIGCTVHSNSSAKFTWKKLETNSEVTLCSTSDYFTIHEISQSDAGLYEVEVINELGNQTGFVEITVMERKLDVIPVETNPTGILVTTSCGALASTGVLLSALYYIYRKSNLRGSYHMPREQIL